MKHKTSHKVKMEHPHHDVSIPKQSFYAGAHSKVATEAENKKEAFKKGGKAKKHVGKVHGAESAHHAGRKPRKSGGALMSAAHAGTPRKSASHY